MTLRSRIAPTPSGSVHVGNAVNFVIAERLVRDDGGRLGLRIDDLDPQRISRQSVEDVFWALDWLEISIDEGPRDAEEFRQRFRHESRTDYYAGELAQAVESGLRVYYCTCSRAELARGGWLGSNDWTGHPCRTRERRPDALHTTRVTLDAPVTIRMNGTPRELRLPDPVVWRRDGLPGYHLASLVDDRDAGIDLIVRGHDLLESSQTQLALAPHLRATTFATARFVHHALIVEPGGEKLSKSQKSESLRTFAERGGTRADLHGLADRILDLPPDQHYIPTQLYN